MTAGQCREGRRWSRAREVLKYVRAYAASPGYRMSKERRLRATVMVRRQTVRANRLECVYRDVGCGRGEMLDVARAFGYSDVAGCEVVPELVMARDDVVPAPAQALPWADKSADVVTCFDVLEHLVPGDEVEALRELFRVAGLRVNVTVSNISDLGPCGEELHINRRDYADWHEITGRVATESDPAWRGRYLPGCSVPGLNEAWEFWNEDWRGVGHGEA